MFSVEVRQRHQQLNLDHAAFWHHFLTPCGKLIESSVLLRTLVGGSETNKPPSGARSGYLPLFQAISDGSGLIKPPSGARSGDLPLFQPVLDQERS